MLTGYLASLVIFIPSSVLVALIGWYVYWKNTRNKILIDRVPGFKDWPLVGDVLHLERDPTDFLQQLLKLADVNRSHKILKLKFLELPQIMLFSAEDIEKLLSSKVNIDKSPQYSVVHGWLGLGLLTSSGAKWRSRRKMITPSFHFSILKEYLVLINEHSRKLRDKLLLDASDTGQSYDIYEDVTLNTLDIICDTAMGVNVNALAGGQSEYVDALQLIKDETIERAKNPLILPDVTFNMTAAGRRTNKAISLAHKFTMQVIKERRKAKHNRESSEPFNAKHKPFLDLLLDCTDEDGLPLTDSDIREEVDTFMFEGHDTTSTAIGFAVHLLGNHAEIQRKCQEELNEVLGDTSDDLSVADLSKMTYLECCIKETLRLFPPAAFLGRSLAEDTELAGYTIPKGVSVLAFTMGLHRDPKVFPNPENFDPDRFMAKNCIQRNPFSYIPFSAGPRNCIGQKFAMMEMKVLLAMILHNFTIVSTQTEKELKVRPALVLQPSNGILVKLYKRV